MQLAAGQGPAHAQKQYVSGQETASRRAAGNSVVYTAPGGAPPSASVRTTARQQQSDWWTARLADKPAVLATTN